MTRDKYRLTLNDCAGEFYSAEFAAMPEVVSAVRSLMTQYPTKIVCVSNMDRCDYDTDGLTEDEREMLDEVM